MYSRYQAAKAEGRVDPLAGGMNEDRIAKLEQIGFGMTLLKFHPSLLSLANTHTFSLFVFSL
jgi:hypothetical protein